MNDINLLEQWVIAIEQAGVNLAPTYQEYMPLAFAVANSCGEPGRSLFQRICRMSDKYRAEDADKLYGHALKNGRGKNSLGTVFHLAELAGVRLDKKLANLQNLQPPLTHTHAREHRSRYRKRQRRKTSVRPPAPALLPGLPVAGLPAASDRLRRHARTAGLTAAGSGNRIRSHRQPADELLLRTEKKSTRACKPSSSPRPPPEKAH